MKILIVEDEELSADKLVETIRRVEPEAVIAGFTQSIKSTVEWLRKEPAPDLILMDIELSDGQSFEIFNQVEVTSMVVFTTSYDEFALKAFQVNSIGYLLKPVQKEELAKAFERFRKFSPGSSVSELIRSMQSRLIPKEFRKRFLVKHAQKQIPIDTTDIAYFFIHDRILFFRTHDNRKFIVDYTLDETENMLDPGLFFRVNRSFLVHAKSILQVHSYFNNRLVLTVMPDAGEQVIVSRDKVNDFKKWIGV